MKAEISYKSILSFDNMKVIASKPANNTQYMHVYTYLSLL